VTIGRVEDANLVSTEGRAVLDRRHACACLIATAQADRGLADELDLMFPDMTDQI
jgi:hypothetical protein